MTIEYDKSLHIAPFTVGVSTKDARGYFEHDRYGEEVGGELWFEASGGKLELVDYDGTFALPGRVIKALEQMGVVVPNEFR